MEGKTTMEKRKPNPARRPVEGRHVVQGRPVFLPANKRTSFNFSLDDIDFLKNRASPNGSELLRRLLREHRVSIGDLKQ